jgi:hypothetical protein
MSRIYRTADGRHVAEGDPAAAFLAYADGDDVPKDVLAEVEGKPKRGRKPADKQADKPADKGGLTISRPITGHKDD